MITGADVKSGYGQKREKPYNSILPYIKDKKVKEAESVKEADLKTAKTGE